MKDRDIVLFQTYGLKAIVIIGIVIGMIGVITGSRPTFKFIFTNHQQQYNDRI